MSTLGGLATEVTTARDLNGRNSEQQAVHERRKKDEVDLYIYAKQQSIDDPSFTSDEDEARVPPKPQLFKLADLIVKGPREGETFADRIAKYAIERRLSVPAVGRVVPSSMSSRVRTHLN